MKSFLVDESWAAYLAEEFEKPYMKDLATFLQHEKTAGKIIYPPGNQIFEAFNRTPFKKVKVVILGQDPYHGPDQAHGLSFSVQPGIKPPPSLVNIYKELQSDMKLSQPKNGCLKTWAEEGVLLLNNVLTVENAKAGSHHKHGWELFTDKVIEILNDKKEHLVFILWGSTAHKKAHFVDPKKHFLIKTVHPSPLASYRGFFGSKPFSKTNHYLKLNGLKEINWDLS